MIDSSPAIYFQKEIKYPKNVDSMDFDLFKLSDFVSLEQAMYFKGAGCRELFTRLVADVCQSKKCLRQHLSKELAEFYESNLTTMQKYIFSKDYFPVYLTSKLISFLSKEKQTNYFEEFNKNVVLFKHGTSHNWLLFPKQLSSELAWLCGAVAADGWITKEICGNEKIGIIDFHEKALLKAALYFERCFGYKPEVKRNHYTNAWQIVFRSKTITRFFTTYLGFHYGPKAHDICEPSIIKNSLFRLDFACGALCFDGSVEIDGVVSLGCASEQLVKDVFEVFCGEGLTVRFQKKIMPKETLFFVKSEGLLQHKDSEKWISLFGLDTEKGQRLNSLVNGFKDKCISEEDALLRLKKFVNYTRRKPCPIYKIFDVLKEEGTIKRQELLKKTGLPHCTFYKYAWVLRKANIISCYTGQFWRGFENTYHFNYDVCEWRVPMVS